MWLNSPRPVPATVPVTPVDAAQPAAKKNEAPAKSTASEAKTTRAAVASAQQEQPQ
jgi:hypothetical protein